MIEAMIDIETMDNSERGSRVLSIGALLFDDRYPQVIKTKSWYPCLDQQELLGTTVGEETMDWWSQQSQEARAIAFGIRSRKGVLSTIREVKRFLARAEAVWANPPEFDLGNLQFLADQTDPKGLGRLVTFWKKRDLRTIRAETGITKADNERLWRQFCPQTIPHEAVGDCLRQLETLREARRRIRGGTQHNG